MWVHAPQGVIGIKSSFTRTSSYKSGSPVLTNRAVPVSRGCPYGEQVLSVHSLHLAAPVDRVNPIGADRVFTVENHVGPFRDKGEVARMQFANDSIDR